MCIDWREESIHEMNKPPSEVKGDGNRKQNHTEKDKETKKL